MPTGLPEEKQVVIFSEAQAMPTGIQKRLFCCALSMVKKQLFTGPPHLLRRQVRLSA